MDDETCTDNDCAAHGELNTLREDNARLAREVAELQARLNALHDIIRRGGEDIEQLLRTYTDRGKTL